MTIQEINKAWHFAITEFNKFSKEKVENELSKQLYKLANLKNVLKWLLRLCDEIPDEVKKQLPQMESYKIPDMWEINVDK